MLNSVEFSSIELNLSLSASSFSKSLSASSSNDSENVISNLVSARRDSMELSASGRAMNFLRSSLINNGFSVSESENFTKRFTQNPQLSDGFTALFTLLEPLFDDKDKFRAYVEKFMAGFARLTGNSSNSSTAQVLDDLASKIENVVSNSDVQTAEVELSVEISVVEGDIQLVQKNQTDPIIIDMDGNGFSLTSAEDGAEFDINADGNLDKTAVTKDGDGMLAVDKNNNGIIDDGKELFGDQNGSADGFMELARYDGNKDGLINDKDDIFKDLKILRFIKKSDGTYEQKLNSIYSTGIKAIDISRPFKTSEINGENVITKRSFAYTENPGLNLNIADALLENYRL